MYSKIKPNICHSENMSIRKITSFPFIALKNLSFIKQRKKKWNQKLKQNLNFKVPFLSNNYFLAVSSLHFVICKA